ncbi:glycosyltransferase family 32 protein [Janthinobacterium sp. OK676]|uniref:glycosyltransferase family 32 protein n=1 Tax=Janthinobacterium sp. OK676 TaxID=1855295 RepID=UPI000B87C67A|nr:glycosyltransferase [Janthinobacterium sp. OK676]
MIPRVIHYCWFGEGEMSVLHRRCIESWQKYCPEYELMLWNEKNSDIHNEYCKEAIIQKKWAFVSDWVRFDVLAKYGGIYLDTDLELIRSLDSLLELKGCLMARETSLDLGGGYGTGFLACEAENPVILLARQLMSQELIPKKVFATSPVVLKRAVEMDEQRHSLQLDPVSFYPFNPHDRSNPRNAMQLMYSDITQQTLGIHHYGLKASWVDRRMARAIFKALKLLGLQRRWDISFTPFQRSVRAIDAS